MRPSKHPQRLLRQRAMTLLEVMMALVIFAIAALSLTKSMSEMIGNLPILEERTLAQWVADNQMVDARLEPGFPAIGKKDGEVELAGRTWYWRKEVIKTTDDKFRLIRIKVSDDDRYSRTLAEINSYVFDKE
ncbi:MULTISPECIES: type II secretion system minor pseudopilin GspI [Shewanella]|jgi:general secretion pathway protein I|uniref:Type II secretion system protein I n=2 Tax=Shewanella TaxID=22 RepID=A0AAJ1BLF8_9GAMM|nr:MULTISPECIES: type II secretion system minor pseudopilin GspI [Shewanella]AZQ12912.1 Putative type II secretion system protein I precursor [Shewanella khirikhana]MCH4295982.1 type II secretion system minor pseudopilin GspI [Shewanella zhuhaiensis]